MKTHTEGPYRLTLKSNGCLILISALSHRHVLVASKHSLGTTTVVEEPNPDVVNDIANTIEKLEIGDNSVTEDKQSKKKKDKQKGKQPVVQSDDAEEKEAEAHAEVGRRWLRRTLEKSGKSEADLAKQLWDSNTTAVLEVRHASDLPNDMC